jgi:hypothetical protein
MLGCVIAGVVWVRQGGGRVGAARRAAMASQWRRVWTTRPAAPVTLEAWVRLDSYRNCPILAARGKYRLGLFCATPESPSGHLVFAGPFADRAYLSDAPLPLGAWVHVAGRHDDRSALVMIDGRNVTAGRIATHTRPTALGYDPWERLATLCAQRPRAGCPSRGRPGGAPDGEVAGSRLILAARSPADIAAARGVPGHFAPLPPPVPAARGARQVMAKPGDADFSAPDSSAQGAPGGSSFASPRFCGSARRVTGPGWAILSAALFLGAALSAAAALLWSRAPAARPARRAPKLAATAQPTGLLPRRCDDADRIACRP